MVSLCSDLPVRRQTSPASPPPTRLIGHMPGFPAWLTICVVPQHPPRARMISKGCGGRDGAGCNARGRTHGCRRSDFVVANTPGIRSGLFHQAKSTQCPNSNAACRGAAASASPHCWPAEIWGVSYLGSSARRRLGGADSSLAGVRFPAAASNVLQLTALVVADVEASIGFLLRAA